MELYPLKFKPIYKEKIWGGQKLQKNLDRDLPAGNIGESWEIAAHPNGTSVVANGRLAGISLPELVNKYPEKVMGKHSNQSKKSFPLLVKLLDADRKLSVQVHPDDNYARRVEGESGKTEMWYIIDTEPGARLIYGLKPGTTREDVKSAINTGNLEKHLNRVNVRAGDVFFMPSGTLHGIEEGILLAEIQQNSDTTYRVYDWNRKGKDGNPRTLHIEKALDVIKYKKHNDNNKKSLQLKQNNVEREILAACPHFITEKLNITKEFNINPDNKFYILLNLQGEGNIIYNNEKYHIKPGDTYFIPASLSGLKISGNIENLLTYLPEDKERFISKLKGSGIKSEEIQKLRGINEWEKK